MKRKLCVLMILFLSFFVCLDRVDGRTAMYLECYMNNSNCNGIDSCKENINWNTFVLVNRQKTNDGTNNTTLWNVIDSNNFYNNFKDVFKYIGLVSHDNNDCWFNDINNIDKKCTDKDVEKLDGGIGNLGKGICPLGVRKYKNTGGTFKVPAGVASDNKSVSFVGNSEYVLYIINTHPDSYKLSNLKKNTSLSEKDFQIVVMEAYDKDGTYAYAMKLNNPNSNSNDNELMIDFLSNVFYFEYNSIWESYFNNYYISTAGISQLRRLYNINKKEDFFKVSSNFDATLASLAVQGSDESFITNYENSIIKVFDSTESGREELEDLIVDWYTNNDGYIQQKYEKIKFLREERVEKLYNYSSKLIESVENNKSFSFNSEYSVEMMLEDLEYALDNIEEYDLYLSNNDNPYSQGQISSYITYSIMRKYFGTENGLDSDIFVNPTFKFGSILHGNFLQNGENVDTLNIILYSAVEELSEELSSAGKITYFKESEFKEKFRIFTLAVNYLSKYSSDFALSDSQIQKLNDLRISYSTYGEKYDVNVAVDCRGLIGEELLAKINNVLDIFKIVIPILLIGLGILDYVKAVFASDDGKMREAQTLFFKRIGIAVIIYLIPILVNVILEIANKVWTFINPDACGIFY